MKIRSFKRGIILPDNKRQTQRSAIRAVLPVPGEQLRFALRQHIGAVCRPLVRTGERVLTGQKIADTKESLKEALSAPVHSSVSGIVKGFAETLLPNGEYADAIVIENDGLFEDHPSIFPRGHVPDGFIYKRPEDILNKIREAGIVGLGGAGFPTHVKLAVPDEAQIDFLIVNAAECEPYLTGDHRLLIEEPERLILGIKILQRLFPNAVSVIAVPADKADIIAKLTRICRKERGIGIAALSPKYPKGSEKQLIYACTGIEVPRGGLPCSVGCVVLNIDTVIAVERAIRRRRPLMRRVITVCGGAVKHPGNYKAPIGLSYESLITAAGGFIKHPAKIISGGPMMGVALHDTDIPVTKQSSSIICLTAREAHEYEEVNCIRCGKCVGMCPMGLVPLEISKYAEHDDKNRFISNNGNDCIACGCCTYICPSKRRLSQNIRSYKRRLGNE